MKHTRIISKGVNMALLISSIELNISGIYRAVNERITNDYTIHEKTIGKLAGAIITSATGWYLTRNDYVKNYESENPK